MFAETRHMVEPLEKKVQGMPKEISTKVIGNYVDDLIWVYTFYVDDLIWVYTFQGTPQLKDPTINEKYQRLMSLPPKLKLTIARYLKERSGNYLREGDAKSAMQNSQYAYYFWRNFVVVAGKDLTIGMPQYETNAVNY